METTAARRAMGIGPGPQETAERMAMAAATTSTKLQSPGGGEAGVASNQEEHEGGREQEQEQEQDVKQTGEEAQELSVKDHVAILTHRQHALQTAAAAAVAAEEEEEEKQDGNQKEAVINTATEGNGCEGKSKSEHVAATTANAEMAVAMGVDVGVDVERMRTLRIAFVGNVDSGKSSLIGTLIKGDLDDGRGLSRQAIFRHQHEVESGRTSSVATAYMGFDAEGQQILSKRAGKTVPWMELARISHKRIQLIDLAGHERYLKTTVFGLTGMQPDIVVVVVGANMGVKRMTKEHLAIAVALEIPLIVALTKIDIAPQNVAKETLQTIRQSLKRYGKMPMLVKTDEQALTAVKGIPSNRVTPILPLSNVTGDGLENLRRIFFGVSPTALFKASLASTTMAGLRATKANEEYVTADEQGAKSASLVATAAEDGLVEMPIDETFQVPGVGFILAGTLVTGKFHINDTLLLGPDYNGAFFKVVVRSMESMYVPMKEILPGQTAAISVRSANKKHVFNRQTFRKGMVLVSPNVNVSDYVSMVFEARVVILHHQTTVAVGYQPMINCRTIRQTAEIVSIQSPQDVIRTGDRALVRFRFLHAPEFLKKGMRFVFRDGQAKGIGKVVRIVPPAAK